MNRHVTLLVALALILLTACSPQQPAPPSRDAGQQPSPQPPSSVSAAPAATATTVADPVQAVLADYLRSWDVYANAMRQLDDSHLGDGFAGQALGLVRDEITYQKTRSEPTYIDVTHHPKVIFLKGADAVVRDDYENRSVTLDPGQSKPTKPAKSQVIRQRRSLHRFGSRWKVVLIVQERRA